MFLQLRRFTLALPLTLAFGACMADTGDTTDTTADTSDSSIGSASEALAPLVEIPFQPFEDPAGIANAGTSERRVLIGSAQQYKTLFGHAAPPSVSFEQGDKVIFYSAGAQPSTDFVASVERVQRFGWFLRISTRLTGPAPDCLDSPMRAIPYVLAKVRAPGNAYQDFLPTERVIESCDTPSCDDVECDAGSHCELEQVVCVRAPCPPIPMCVENRTNPCALLLCPANTVCVELDGDGVCQPIPNRDPCANHPCPVGQVCTAPADRPHCVRDPRSMP